MGFPKQEYWSGLPLLSPGDLPDPGIKPTFSLIQMTIISTTVENQVALTVNKRVQNAILGCNLKNDRMILVHFQGKLLNVTVIQVMLQPLMLKKLKFSSSMRTNNTF